MVTRDDYKIDERPTWCSGCGDYGILNALTFALVEHEIPPHEVMIVTGIGCGSKLPQYMRVNGMHTLHGRPWPIAQGAKLANHDMRVVIVHGDGDGYGEGLGHFVHAVRRNPGVTELVQNNLIYGLTKGQFSPTSEKGWKTSTSPHGSAEAPVQPLALALTHGATFVGRGFPGDLKHLRWLIGEALEHPGYAFSSRASPSTNRAPTTTTASGSTSWRTRRATTPATARSPGSGLRNGGIASPSASSTVPLPAPPSRRLIRCCRRDLPW
jgi:2-oxoglutarate/2-oxoacid ferredoxin oxidoreductase subunit beta